ncbi:MAG: 16S rRNA (cytosine(1402)-N(4))-methyltransferase RsmH [Clostridia bacterium]|nr:16S rRNA (cytosine(1402)-N(4))-methyltransferase RsmH [Clostridia bacterium]MBO7156910.1 16S rRNA (cytosine(1402)-N(4))-methyltransferase RsmH [Clostridia bacterium]
MEFKHVSVLYSESIEGLNVKPDGVYVDGTLGGAGHSKGILEKLQNGRLICNDLDLNAIDNAKSVLAEYLEKVTFIHDDYKNLIENLDDLGIDGVDGILLDLGVSSPQIDDPNRGFSYSKAAPLDMRMDTTQTLDAKVVVNTYKEEELSRIFFEYGEDKLSRKIARAIVREREKEPITTTDRLADIIERCYPAGYRFKHGHPAKRVFQAIRIEVNGELEGLYDFIYNVALRLKVGGRMAVITFHSLEDRIVKNAFTELEKDCICDKHLPVCVCNKRREVKILTKKPIVASEEELKNNKRAESAKLRIVERV